MESISLTLRKGFQTWTHNLNICIPFFLNVFLGMFVIFGTFVIAIALLILPAMPSLPENPDAIEPEMVIGILNSSFYDNFLLMGLIALIAVILLTIIGSYFEAGAIGMAKKASEKGTSTIGDMFTYGRENFVNLFLIKFILLLIMLTGIIFIVPGILSVGDLEGFFLNPEEAASGALILVFGMLLWTLYIMVVELVFTYSEYAVVVENLDPVTALEKGFSVFMQNKLDTFLLWLFIISISILIALIGQMMGTIEALGTLWSFTDFVISFAVIQPLTAIWWTRMFMRRTGKEIYDIDEYLEYV
ncbi:flagellar biosynthesis protein FlhB [Methanohalophilus levihalophilus]|uniref:DUF7847 domain-containing protein n=1 Tax=Methanohalophilus levihalophilus TaxID=1431282 RepID=UPI001AE7B74D|nr:hypothetical protein [Methanohalophilus levihalophilus]MBP2029202.1 flagellar biosynthesis protein FlhB [Methanohalophilus levihalophilus]